MWQMITGDVCRAGVLVGNSWFKKKDVYKYTWSRKTEGRVVDRALMDYVVLSK